MINTTRDALLSAYYRLRSGNHSGVTDGRVSIENVALEAGKGRATAYRCADLVELFNPKSKSPAHGNSDAKSDAAKEKLARKRSTERHLRDVIKRLLNRIILLEAREKHLLKTIDRLEKATEIASNVTQIKPSHG